MLDQNRTDNIQKEPRDESPFLDITGDILLVEPDEGLRDALKAHMTRLGAKAVAISTGKESLDLLKNSTPPLVICAADIPDMDITEFLRLAQTISPDTAVIIMDGKPNGKRAISLLRLNAADYIHKPVESDALETALERAVIWRKNRIKTKQRLKQMESLHQTKVLFQQLFDEVPCYISIQDKNFRLTGANRRFKEEFGDTIGAICYEIYKHRDQPCSKCPVMDTFEDGMPHQTEEVVTTRSGKTINVLTWTAPIRDANGEITQVIEMATNISQVRNLQSRLTSIGLLMSSMSHSIKGMLAALDGGIYKLESGLAREDKERLLAGTELVKEMADQIRKTVMNVLYYTKERELNTARINVRDFTKDVVSIIKEKARSEGVGFVFALQPGMGSFEIDPGPMRSALINILENCIEACVDDPDKNKEHVVALNVNVCGEDGAIVYEIKDNGIGMDRETAEKVFTLFFSSKGNSGTGLGLYIANQVVLQHGGRINLKSEKGKGSVFTVRLPRIKHQKSDNATLLKDV